MPFEKWQRILNGMNEDKQKCKDCQFWGRYYGKPGWQGYCIQLAKDKDGLEEACKLWKSDNLSSQL